MDFDVREMLDVLVVICIAAFFITLRTVIPSDISASALQMTLVIGLPRVAMSLFTLKMALPERGSIAEQPAPPYSEPAARSPQG